MEPDDDIKRMMDDFSENLVTFYDSMLMPIQDNLSQMAISIGKSMPDFSPLIIKTFEPLQETFAKLSTEKFKQDLEESANLMFDNGWWFIPKLPPYFYIQLLKEEEVNQQNLTDVLVEYHNKGDCKELGNMLKQWNLDEFNDNMQIFEDALWAHKKAKFTLTVPALTIQVEGIIRSYLDHISEWNFSEYRKLLKDEYDKAIKNENKDLGFEKFFKIQNIKFLEKRMESLYGHFDPSKPKELNDLNRHALFHGRYKHYNTIEMSTKLFLFLDMIHHILNDLEKFKQAQED